MSITAYGRGNISGTDSGHQKKLGMTSRLYGFTNSEVLYLETLRIAISMDASSINQISDIK